ncbi:MAG: hypothetical protein Q7T26_00475 [Dehalococcoidia bacterium]|nr:hypothetical protein [Dehalococcoidia bacterium]
MMSDEHEEIGPEGIRLTNTFEAVNEMMYKTGMTDGLPIVPPTPERLERFLKETSRKSADVVAAIPPKNGMATVEKIAINAVMAGCPARTLPVVIAAVAAMSQEPFNLLGIQTTTGTASVGLILNGPHAMGMGFSGGAGALGAWNRANASVGRAIHLILLNIGGATPADIDMATLGWPGKFTFCFAENEMKSPWSPLHVERGFHRDESTVTVVGAAGIVEMVDTVSNSAESILTTMANSMSIAGTTGVECILGGGEPLLIVTPEHAHLLARDGFNKAEVKRFLYEHARLPLSRLGKDSRARVKALRERLGVADLDADLRVAHRAEDIMLVVVGGIGFKSAYVPTWPGGTTSVTVRVEK